MAASDQNVPRLIVIGPAEHQGLVLSLSIPEMVIGHSETADIVLDNRYVSRRHALIAVDPGGSVTIHDLNSTGGTFVNDERLRGPRVLHDGDLVRFAELVARFEPAEVPHDAAATSVMPPVAAPRPPASPPAAPPPAAPPPEAPPPEAPPPEAPPPEADDDDGHLVVRGHVSWPDGGPVAGITVRAVDQDLRAEQPLGPHAPGFRTETRTDGAGAYEIRYTSRQFARAEDQTADLIIRALDSAGAVVAAASTLFNASASVVIDLTVTGAAAGQPSEYERLVSVVSPLLQDVEPPDITALKPSDLDFLAGETGAGRAQLNDLLSAVTLYGDARAAASTAPTAARPTAPDGASRPTHVPVAAFYGLLREGLTADWAALLRNGAAAINSALLAAVDAGIVPADLRQSAAQIAVGLSGLAAAQVAAPAGASAPSAAPVLSQLLGAASLSAAQQATVVSAAATATGTSQEFWSGLAGQPGFETPASVARLQLTLQLGMLTGSHLPLIQQLLSESAVSSVTDLVAMDSTAWTALLATSAGGQPIGVPAGVPGSTPAEQSANYVQGLMSTLAAAFPNEKIASLVASSAIAVPDAGTRDGIGTFFANSPDFDVRTTRISSYVSEHQDAAFAGIAPATQPAVISQLKRLQRAFQVSVSSDSMTRLLSLGLDAAHLVAEVPPKSFTDRFASSLGGTDIAEAIYRRATFINARSSDLIVQLNDVVNGAWPAGLTGGAFGNGEPAGQAQILEQHPDYAELFGALDPCNCEDCLSVLSPAAYFVAMLQFLRNSAPNAAGNTPLDVLIGTPSLPGRRPDLAYLKLTCENTNTELPYIDLVNEVMESYISLNGPTMYAAHDTGEVTTAQLDASPQYTIDGSTGPAGTVGPYLTLAGAVYPFTLPYNQPIAVARTYLQSLGTSRFQLLDTFQVSPATAAAAIDAEYLGLDPYLYQLLTGTAVDGSPATAIPVAQLYGFAPPHAGWPTTVAAVPAFLQRTGIEATDLITLLQTRFINPSYPAGPDQAFLTEIPFGYATLMTLVSAGFVTTDSTILGELSDAHIPLTGPGSLQEWWQRNPDIGQLLIIDSPAGSCDLDDATIAQLADLSVPADASLDAMQGFIRLWRVLGWSMTDLDRAISVLGMTGITAGLIRGLARIGQLQATLSPSCLQVLFAMWGPLDPGGADSLYQQLFLNPAALPQDAAFGPTQTGAVLQDPASPISAHIPALLAALQISAADLALICAAAQLDAQTPAGAAPLPAAAQLSLANVSAMYRYAALAQLLSLSVADFLTLRSLAGPALDPFQSPDTAVAFAAVAQQLQESGCTVSQLGYLYQHISAPPTGLAPQPTTLLVLAQALRDGLTAIAAQCAIVADPKGTVTASTITQLVSKAVATQTVAMINGTAVYLAPLAAADLPAGLSQHDGSGELTGTDPAQTPASVGAKLSYDPVAGTLRYAGAMTTQERTDLLAVPAAGPAFEAAIASLHQQPAAFLADNLAPLLSDPNAAGALLSTTASVDPDLNAVLVNADGTAYAGSDPTLAASTAISWKFSYLLAALLPYLQSTLSHTLAKQTMADAFTLDPAITSLLLEQVLTLPDAPGTPVIGDLLALSTPGLTATFYATPDLSGTATGSVIPEVAFDASSPAATLPAGTLSASFAGWLEAPASATFTFTIRTNGTPQLHVGDRAAVVPLTPEPATGLQTATVALTAGGFTYVGLDVTGLPAGPGTAVLSWQNPATPAAPIPGSVLLPDALYQAFQLAYVRIQKAAMLVNLFALSAPEIQYLTAAGKTGLFAGFDLNALPLAPGIAPAQATALFTAWGRLQDYTAVRNVLPAGSVSLVDVFSATTFTAARALLPQATGWDEAVVADLLAAFFPLPPAGNPIVDEQWPARLQPCVALIQQVGASAAQLFGWAGCSWPTQAAAFDGLHQIASQIKQFTASHYDPVSWLSVAEQLSNTLRSSQRDALVSYLLGQLGSTDPNSLFELLLIDPEMGTCMQTSRIRQALNSVQLYVQRCLLNLEQGDANPAMTQRPPALSATDWQAAITVEPGQIDGVTWQEWMSAYSTWAGTMEIFLWPENLLLPALRDDQTPIFETFASALQQGTITSDTASASFLDYLQGLEQVDRLDIRCTFWQAPADGSPAVLHVFARTWHDPRAYFYRQLIGNPGHQSWTPWQQIQVDIQGDFLVPVIWEGRLRLIWPVFTQQTYAPPISGQLTQGTGSSQTPNAGPAPQPYWQISLAWSEFYQGAWQPKQVSADFLDSFYSVTNADFYDEGTDTLLAGPLQPAAAGHVFKARLDGADLVIDTYVRFDSPVQYSTSGLIAELKLQAETDTNLAAAYQALANVNANLAATLGTPLGDGFQQISQQEATDAKAASTEADLATAIAETLVGAGIHEGRGPLLLGEFRFSACGDTVTVGYTDLGTPPSSAASPHQTSGTVSSARLLLPPGTDAFNNGFRQSDGAASVLRLLTGGFGDTAWPFTQPNAPSSTPITYLNNTPSQFELRHSQQDWQFAAQAPFFYQDAQRTFYAAPVTGSSLTDQLADPARIDAASLLTSLSAAAAAPAPPAPAPPAPAPEASRPVTANDAAPTANDPAPTVSDAVRPAAAAPLTYQQLPRGNWLIPDYLGPVSVIVQPAPGSLSLQTHRHPYACTLINDLVAAQGQDQSGGIGALLNVANQNLSNGFSFDAAYQPDPAHIVQPYPAETIDFSPGGPYSVYNWELNHHGPLLVAETLSQNGQYADAASWFRYILDFTNSDTGTASPQRYWQFQPFRTPAPQTLLQLMGAINAGDPAAVAQYADWYDKPFDPFRLARLRVSAFQKYDFMAVQDNLIAWADYQYGQVDSIESINYATQLYVSVSDNLGQLPEQIPSPQSPAEYDYTEIRSKLDAFSNFSEMLENEFPFASPVASNPQSQSSGLLGLSKILFFCIPPNPQLLGYWSKVASRLSNIRNCLNIQGIPQQLALFVPPANPLTLVEAMAQGVDPGSVLADVSAPLPNYRFSYLIAKSAELAAACQGLGRQLLEVLEKNDAEGLALLRATQETAILTLMHDTKQQQVTEAQANVAALTASRAVALARYNFYQLLLGAGGPASPEVGASIPPATIPSQPSQSSGGVQLIAAEQSELDLSGKAALLHGGAGLLETLASIQSTIPTVSATVDLQPFGVGASVGASFGGSNLAASTEAVVHALETAANYLTYQAWAAGKMGGFFRRQQEWALQSNLAAAEIMQIDQQTSAAGIRVTIAQDDLLVNEQQTANAQKIQDTLTGKFTSQQLYGWMIGQVSSLYSQLYQLAYGTAKLAEVAYQRELAVSQSSYITFGYWDSLRKGLLAGDRLQLAVQQLERAYIDQNQREFEITRHVSLLLHDPGALMALKATGECVVELPEQLFDMDYPGHYLRRLRDVSLTIPCVAGPYTSINCTLTLVSSKIRSDPGTGTGSAASGPGSYPEKPSQDPRFIYSFGSTAAIATSHGQDDSGVFSVNFRDERYLPFETAGAVSRWMISMPQACNAFDFDTITDVVLKLSYTSRYGGDLLRRQAFSAAVLPAAPQQTRAPLAGQLPGQAGLDRLFSVKHEFPTGWYQLLNPASSTAAYGQMPLWITADRFPFQYRGRPVKTTDIEVFALLRPGTTLTSLQVDLTAAGPPPPLGSPPPAAPVPAAGTDQVTLGTQSLYGATVLYGVKPAATSTAVPQLWWLSLAEADLAAVSAQVADFFVLFHYSVT